MMSLKEYFVEKVMSLYHESLSLEKRIKIGRFVLKRLIPPIMKISGGKIEDPHYTIFFDPSDARGAWHFFNYKLRGRVNEEPYICSLLMKAIDASPDCILFDIGANFGMHTLEICGTEAYSNIKRGFAIEPDMKIFGYLERSIKQSGFDKILPINAAFMDLHQGRMGFYTYKESSSHNRILIDGFENDLTPTYKVPTVTLDGLLEHYSPGEASDLVIKMDIEGNEFYGFKGMEESLKSAKSYLIIFEFCPKFMSTCGYCPYEFARYLMNLDNDFLAEIDSENNKLLKINSLVEFEALIKRLLLAGPGDFITNILVRRGQYGDLSAEVKGN